MRRGHTQQAACHRGGNETGRLDMDERRVNEDSKAHLSASLSVLADGFSWKACWSWGLKLQDEWGGSLKKKISVSIGDEEEWRLRGVKGAWDLVAGGKGKDLQLAYFFPWPKKPGCSQVRPAGAEGWNN